MQWRGDTTSNYVLTIVEKTRDIIFRKYVAKITKKNFKLSLINDLGLLLERWVTIFMEK